MGELYRQLDLDERCTIARLCEAGRSIRQIAADRKGEYSLEGKKGKAFAAEMAKAAERNEMVGKDGARTRAPSVRRSATATSVLSSSKGRGGLPKFRPPQLATLVDAVPVGNGWLHEIKFDGYRALIACAGTRRPTRWSPRSPRTRPSPKPR